MTRLFGWSVAASVTLVGWVVGQVIFVALASVDPELVVGGCLAVAFGLSRGIALERGRPA